MTIIIVIIVIGGVVVIGLILDAVQRNVRASQAVARNECVLVTAVVLQDVCAGRCPAGQNCVAIRRRPYGPRFFGAEQDAECDCR